MPEERSTEERLYRVVLLDRSTSAKINNFICATTGISKWEAAALMNNVPSAIMEGLSLHEAIEIKSHIEHLGARTKVESYILGEELIGDEPPKETPDKTEPVPVETPPEVQPVKHSHPTKKQPLKSAKKPTRKKKKEPKNRKALYIAITAVMTAVIIIIVCVPVNEYFGKEDKYLTHYQDPGKLPKKLKFMNSGQEETKKLTAMNKDTNTVLSLKPDKPPVSKIHGSKKSPLSGFSKALGGGKPKAGAANQGTTGSPGQGGREKAGSGSLAAGGAATPDQKGSAYNYDAGNKTPSEGNPAGQGRTGLSSSEKQSRLPVTIPDRPQRIDDFLKNTRQAVSQNNPRAASEAVRKIEVANMVARVERNSGLDDYRAPEVQQMLKDLKPIADQYEVSQGVDFYPEMTGIRVRVHTNIPDGALMKIVIEVPGQEEPIEYVVPVKENMISLPDVGAFPSGEIELKIAMLPMKDQPPYIVSILGPGGEKLTGPFVEKDGDIKFEDSVINPRARTRGDVSPENAGSELKRLASGAGIENPETTEFTGFDPEELSYITIEAKNVVEHLFITRACRSAGMLTTEMDDPPHFLRLIANGRQYFIPTFICRRLLRDFKKDDPAGYDYLLNSIIAF